MKADLGDLNAFVSVARAGGFREAARATDTSASGLSEAVRRLETQLGIRLLNRTTRSVTPTEAGVIACERLGPWSYRVDMGAPRLAWDAIPLLRPVADTRRVDLWPDGGGPKALGPASLVNMGNPHALFFVPDLKRIDAAELGARIEVHPMFPEKANVTFAEVLARDVVKARVWERGVGLTLACGSAACATLVAASRLGLMERKGTVRLPGGELIIEWRSADDHVLMTGPVEYEGAFVLDDALLEAAAP